MTSFQVRTSLAEPDRGVDHLLDWFVDDKQRSTIAYEQHFLDDAGPSDAGRDLFRIGGAVFCSDKIALRSEAADGWTRSIALTVPVSDVALWENVASHLERLLSFLSGDRWSFDFTPLEEGRVQPVPAHQPALLPIDAACLFSGGLDSLAGAIELLEQGKRLILVGHHDSPKADNVQKLLISRLSPTYPTLIAGHRRLWLRPGAPNDVQARPLPSGEDYIESTTRSRSFLFLAAAIAIADAAGSGTPVYMPENGFIGINVPLTPSRSGSLSTRTTHPLYIDYVRKLLSELGLDHPIENPFRLATKGEILKDSSNTTLLNALAGASVSCSRPEAAHWRRGTTKKDQGNCGACFPCLIRRASMHHVGLDAADDYFYDAFTSPEFAFKGTGASLRALRASLSRPEKRSDVLVNGRIPNGEAADFFEVYSRGRDELRAWLSSHP